MCTRFFSSFFYKLCQAICLKLLRILCFTSAVFYYTLFIVYKRFYIIFSTCNIWWCYLSPAIHSRSYSHIQTRFRFFSVFILCDSVCLFVCLHLFFFLNDNVYIAILLLFVQHSADKWAKKE